jgi:DNA-binding response OmpR family regulator
MHALLIAQDPDEAAVLSFVLQRAGLTASKADALERVLHTGPDEPSELVVLAARENPPIAQIRRFRAQTQALLLVITGQIDEHVHIDLIEAGADLIVPRPYSARLLSAQIRALVRRAGGAPFFTLPILNMADLILDPASRTVQVGSQDPKRLTHLEFRLLYTLMINHDQVIPTESLVEHVWGYTGEGDRDLVRGLVSRLRAKVEANPREPRYVVTSPGVGYSFRSET